MYHRQPCVSKFRDIRKGLLRKISCKISNIALFILQVILQSHPFLMLRKFETHGCQWYGVIRIKSIFAAKGNDGKRFGAAFSYLK